MMETKSNKIHTGHNLRITYTPQTNQLIAVVELK